MTQGIFITFEGGEGAGKTTQINLLAERLLARGLEVVRTREPGGTRLGEAVRSLLVRSSDDPPTPTAELMLYAADRSHHVERIIAPALENGAVVLCDRYADATVAYQGYGRGLNLKVISDLNRLATGGLAPARTVWIDLDPSEGVARSLRRQAASADVRESRFEEEAEEFHRRVRVGYERVCAEEPGRFRRVEGRGSEDEVFARVWEAVGDLFE